MEKEYHHQVLGVEVKEIRNRKMFLPNPTVESF